MKKEILKIILLLLAVTPVWWTIVALASTPEVSLAEQWRSHLNKKLLNVEDRRIQILEIMPNNVALESRLLELPVQVDLSEIRERGVSNIKLHYRDEMGRLVRLIELPVRLYIERRVPVARQDLRQGQQIEASDVEWVWRDSSSVGNTQSHAEELIGAEVRSFVAKGSVIESARLQPRTLVRRGERVQVFVLGSGISVQGFGVAQESGVRGQTIRLLNPSSRKEIYGVITSAQTVEVRM